jgi:hypothetical protein
MTEDIPTSVSDSGPQPRLGDVSLGMHSPLLKRILDRYRNYAELYPEDRLMEELGDNARIWRVYIDETDRMDAELVERWKATLDTLLIFVSHDFSLHGSEIQS